MKRKVWKNDEYAGGNPRQLTAQVEPICAQIRPLLADKHPRVQGAVLLDLLAMWVAGHEPSTRQDVLDAHLKSLWPLVEVNEKIMFDGEGWHE